MLFLSELLSKTVVSLCEARCVGIIKNIYFDAKLQGAKLLELFCEDENDAEKKFIAIKDVYSIGDAVTIKNEACVIFEWNVQWDFQASPMNAHTYSVNGKDEGVICDVELNPKSFAVNALITSNARFERQMVAATSQSVVIIQDEQKPVKLVKPAKKIPKKDDRRVTIARTRQPEPAAASTAKENAAAAQSISELVAQSSPLNKSSQPQAAPNEESYTHYRVLIDNSPSGSSAASQLRIPPTNVDVVRSPQRDFSGNGYGFLIDRIVRQDIADADGQTIIKAGTKIDLSIIELAKNHGKIVQLALNT